MKATLNATGVVAVVGILAAVGVLAWVSRKGVQGAAAATVKAAGDAAAGAVVGLGQVVGIPATDADACAKAKREGRTWDASFACPAGDFIGYLFEPKVDQSILDANDARARQVPRGSAANDATDYFGRVDLLGNPF